MNNSFVDSVCDICGLEMTALAHGYKYSVYDGRAVVVEGHKGIFTYAETEVVFALGRAKLVVSGDKLCIKCLERNFAVVVGVIKCVAVNNA